jgi:UDP-N-acetylglucosamine 2-epimerase (non-hydrolysing)
MHKLKKICLIFGTRPEAIKLCPVVVEFKKHDDFELEICVTGQHRKMLDQVLRVFEVVPDVDLSLMEPNQSLASFTSKALTALDRHLASSRPDLVVIQGDTTTTLCAALAAFYQKIPVAHVEAGLRTGRKDSPFPEEMNRVVTTHLADLHLAPTESARNNLIREGISPEQIEVTGNTVVDALLMAIARVRAERTVVSGLPEQLQGGHAEPKLVLITGHRRESFGLGFQLICKGIAELASRFPETAFVYPVHLNPNVMQPVHSLLGNLPNVYLLEPLDYLPFVALMDRCTLILTDSGGIQEEAPSLGKPVLVMRETTERPEAVEAGVAKLVGTDVTAIVEGVKGMLAGEGHPCSTWPANPYGDGHAAGRIVASCACWMERSRG